MKTRSEIARKETRVIIKEELKMLESELEKIKREKKYALWRKGGYLAYCLIILACKLLFEHFVGALSLFIIITIFE